MTPILVASLSALATIIVAIVGGFFAIAKLSREAETARENAEAKREEQRQAAEDAREERRRAASDAREQALLQAVTRGAEAQAQTAVILDAVKDHLSALRRSEERISRYLAAMLTPDDPRPSAEPPPPPPIPAGRTIHSRPSQASINDASTPGPSSSS